MLCKAAAAAFVATTLWFVATVHAHSSEVACPVVNPIPNFDPIHLRGAWYYIIWTYDGPNTECLSFAVQNNADNTFDFNFRSAYKGSSAVTELYTLEVYENVPSVLVFNKDYDETYAFAVIVVDSFAIFVDCPTVNNTDPEWDVAAISRAPFVDTLTYEAMSLAIRKITSQKQLRMNQVPCGSDRDNAG